MISIEIENYFSKIEKREVKWKSMQLLITKCYLGAILEKMKIQVH